MNDSVVKFRDKSPVVLENIFEIQNHWTDVVQNCDWENYKGLVASSGFFVYEKIHKEININVAAWEDAMSSLWGIPAKLTYVWALMMAPGGHIDPHFDEKHECSAVIYLNPHWKEEWGGRLEFEFPDKWETSAIPERGTAIVWQRDMSQRHRVTKSSLDAPQRISLTTRWKKKYATVGKLAKPHL